MMCFQHIFFFCICTLSVSSKDWRNSNQQRVNGVTRQGKKERVWRENESEREREREEQIMQSNVFRIDSLISKLVMKGGVVAATSRWEEKLLQL